MPAEFAKLIRFQFMDWSEWYKQYDSFPGLQARLRLVGEQIVVALDACPSGPIQIISLCAGDGRDVIGALQGHPRRHDVNALLLDSHAESLARGRAAAAGAGLARQLRFIEADASLASNYAAAVPADLVLISGFLGHLRHEDVPRLIASLPMFCKTGGWAIWNRHLILHDGHKQVPAIREFFRQAKFEEVFFGTPDPNGFAVGRVRFTGRPEPLDASRVLFEFVGLDRLLSVPGEMPQAKLNYESAVERTGDSAVKIFAEAETTIPARFREMVRLHPLRTALGGSAWQPTYTELDSAANRLARAMISRTGKPGDRVALLMRHDAPLSAAALAVLKAGRIVVVLNPSDPPTRLKQIWEDADPSLMVADFTNETLARQIARENHEVVCFEKEISGPALDADVAIAPADIAWLIYTSGSTGKPKGVIQTHRNIAHNVLRLSRGMELSADDRIVLLGSPSGGQGVATSWCALLNGAALFPYPIGEHGAARLKKWMIENKITVYVSSTSVFRNFAQTLGDADSFPDARLVRFGSETATVGDFAAFKKHFPGQCVLLNSLSSSETGNITQRRFAQNGKPPEGRLPVGWPAAGMAILLVDEEGEEIRGREVGEIIVKSRYLSPGYWRNASLTAERFSGSSSANGVRAFQSGDLGQWMVDGSLIFMGRKDARVKVHGYRVELSEIEEALARQPDVAAAAVCPHEALNHELQLVAYVVLRPLAKCSAEKLRRVLRSTLPGYMVPAHFVFLEKFPLTPHGKIDRQALPSLTHFPKILSGRRPKPRDFIEGKLAQIWESALDVSPIGRNDDFFDLGGNSIQSAEVLARIDEAFGTSLSPSTLVEHATIEKLAALLADRVVIASRGPLVLLRGATAGRPLFLVHGGKGDVATYGLLARRLPDRPIYGLQSVGLQGESWPLMSIPAMARRYLSDIVATDPTGPYLLAGTCMGGRIAFEMAQMLVQQGRPVALLALLDSNRPAPRSHSHRLRERLFGPMHNEVRDAFRILRWSIARAVGLTQRASWLPDYRRFVFHMSSRANRRYKPVFYPGAITLFVTADANFREEDLRLWMRRFAQETHVVTIPGNRAGLFVQPAVDELARQLQNALERADRGGAA